ncbi:MAG: PspC domain-containing protein [Candidatus Buchananbacteria bacterium]|nr:PspC domain-containing protein [Candidatus Buchananbacteria bacterium]
MSIIWFLIILAACITSAWLVKKNNIKRDTQNEEIAGVCAGIAKKFNVKPGAVRLAFVLSVIFFGIGILPYIILWVIMEEE